MTECYRGMESGQPARGGDVEDWKRCFWSGVGEHLGLFDVYDEAKTTVSAAEVADRLLQVISRMARSNRAICVLEL